MFYNQVVQELVQIDPKTNQAVRIQFKQPDFIYVFL